MGVLFHDLPWKREIRTFHVVEVQRRQRKLQKSVMHEQSCFADVNLSIFAVLVVVAVAVAVVVVVVSWTS